jgi:hypothetical protein
MRVKSIDDRIVLDISNRQEIGFDIEAHAKILNGVKK